MAKTIDEGGVSPTLEDFGELWSAIFVDQNAPKTPKIRVFESGAIAKVVLCSTASEKLSQFFANASPELVHAILIIAGKLTVERAGLENDAKPGDLVLYNNSSRGTAIAVKSDAECESLALVFSKLPLVGATGTDRFNALIPANKLFEPLASCLAMIAEMLSDASEANVHKLFRTCQLLLPLGVDRWEEMSENLANGNQRLLQRILAYVDHNLSHPDLSPNVTAAQFGISVRYIHKLFRCYGTTFSAHILAQRLERAKLDLSVTSDRRVLVMDVAYRWGFGNLSTFNRAFRKRFGCTPTEWVMSRSSNIVICFALLTPNVAGFLCDVRAVLDGA